MYLDLCFFDANPSNNMTTLLTISCHAKEASDLVKEDTIASYYAANFQFTIGKIVSTHDSDSLNIMVDDLNEEGMVLYNSIQEKIAKGEWEKQILKDASISMERSGNWIRDKDHLAHNRAIEQGCEYDESMGACICSWRNLVCNFMDEDREYRTTIIVMYTDDWLCTYSGKIYKLQLAPVLED